MTGEHRLVCWVNRILQAGWGKARTQAVRASHHPSPEESLNSRLTYPASYWFHDPALKDSAGAGLQGECESSKRSLDIFALPGSGARAAKEGGEAGGASQAICA